MSGFNDGHSVRGRRRGRPPGVRSSRSGTKQESEHRQKTAGARLGRRNRRESSSDAASASEDEEMQENKGSDRSTKRAKVAVDQPATRGRGRRGRQGMAQGNRTYVARSSQLVVADSSDALSSARTSTPASASALVTAAAASVYSVVDPGVFACRRNAEYARCGRQLAEYLDSFKTLLDDRVVSCLPKTATLPSKRKAGSMTIPSAATVAAAQVSSRRRERALAEEKAARRQQMQAEFDAWVQETACTMHRISVLRRRGMLRDSDGEEDGAKSSEPPLCRILPPAQRPPAGRAAEPSRSLTTWDQILSDVGSRHREVTAEARKRRVVLRKRARLIKRNEEERQAQLGIYRNPVAAERAERENRRKLAKWTMLQVMRKWTYVKAVVQEQREAEEQEARAREGKQALFDM
ncbi:hypothetical protein LPJ56_005359, partial [Coemansia sp. RSA 2599]